MKQLTQKLIDFVNFIALYIIIAYAIHWNYIKDKWREQQR